MKKAIVTGAGGFIGKALVKQLLKEKFYVYAISTKKSNLIEFDNIDNVCIIEKDILDINMDDFCEDTIEYFFHLAWRLKDASDRNNINIQVKAIDASISAMKLAEQLKCKKFIFFGTNQQYLYDYNSIDKKFSFCGLYGASKAAASRICQALALGKMEFNCILFTNIYGVGDYSMRTANLFIKKLQQGESIDLISGENLYDWTYIDDAIEGILSVAKYGINNKEYYVGSRKLRTFREIIEELRDIINPSGILNFGKYPDTSFTDYNLIDLNALYEDTGFQCKSDFKESVLKTSEWVETLK